MHKTYKHDFKMENEHHSSYISVTCLLVEDINNKMNKTIKICSQVPVYNFLSLPTMSQSIILEYNNKQLKQTLVPIQLELD